jgi:hypothetical protein
VDTPWKIAARRREQDINAKENARRDAELVRWTKRTAWATWLATLFGGAAACAAAVGGVTVWKQLVAMQEQLEEAKKEARAWVTLEVRVAAQSKSSDVPLNSVPPVVVGGKPVPLLYRVKNIGKTPATQVTVQYFAVLEMQTGYDPLKGSQGQPHDIYSNNAYYKGQCQRMPGLARQEFVLFPDQLEEGPIAEAGQTIVPSLQDSRTKAIHLVACVTYRSGEDGSWHKTLQMVKMFLKTTKPEPFMKNLQEDETAYYAREPGGDFAD